MESLFNFGTTLLSEELWLAKLKAAFLINGYQDPKGAQWASRLLKKYKIYLYLFTFIVPLYYVEKSDFACICPLCRVTECTNMREW